MSPALVSSPAANTISKAPGARPTSILHRTPWIPPIAVAAEGSYIELESGQKLLDAIGGAAVSCIGNAHPAVNKALKDQIDRVSCAFPFVFFVFRS